MYKIGDRVKVQVLRSVYSGTILEIEDFRVRIKVDHNSFDGFWFELTEIVSSETKPVPEFACFFD